MSDMISEIKLNKPAAEKAQKQPAKAVARKSAIATIVEKENEDSEGDFKQTPAPKAKKQAKK